MTYPTAPRPYIAGSTFSNASPRAVLKHPAGCTFGGRPVWRIEVEGVLPVGSLTDLVLYSSSKVLAVVEVRGWVKPVVVNNYMRVLGHARRTFNGNAAVYVRVNSSAQLVIGHLSSITSFALAQFRLQMEFIEV